jgi:cell fate regulator YaaT (PSP1 superfamily)
MDSVVGIKFSGSSKVYLFKSDDLVLKKGDRVVVESDMGMSLGRVVQGNTPTPQGDKEREYKPVVRIATGEDLRQEEENEALRGEARAFFNERVMARGLPMKLVGVESTLDRKRLLFYFVADNRIDFRELVKDLASKFRTRIELRQIGVRDAAKIIGGLGVCGREFCCKSFLQCFAPISIKMAKKQELTLNTCKLSGPCGRLLCCLNFEHGNGGKRRRDEGDEKDDATVETEEELCEARPRAHEAGSRRPHREAARPMRQREAMPRREEPLRPEPKKAETTAEVKDEPETAEQVVAKVEAEPAPPAPEVEPPHTPTPTLPEGEPQSDAPAPTEGEERTFHPRRGRRRRFRGFKKKPQ